MDQDVKKVVGFQVQTKQKMQGKERQGQKATDIAQSSTRGTVLLELAAQIPGNWLRRLARKWGKPGINPEETDKQAVQLR